MFNLEQSIAEWRQQMLAAGIKTPVPLEELESHLREEIEKQIQSGTGKELAFEMTVRQIGQAKELKAEFEKDQGLLAHNKSMKANWFWALFWVALCSWVFFQFFPVVVFNLLGPFMIPTPVFILTASYVVIYGAILLGSVRYFRAAKTGWNFIEKIEDELFKKPKPEHLFLGWFAAGFILTQTVHRLDYFPFFPYSPVAGMTYFYSRPVPVWDYLMVVFNVLAAEIAIWSLTKAGRDKVSRFISLIGSMFLMWLAFANYIDSVHPVLSKVFIEIEPYRVWFQWGQIMLLLMPAFFLILWERRRATLARHPIER